MKRMEVAIVGAGIAGIATAYYLTARYRLSSAVLIDRGQPMSLTTGVSGENYRDFWPQPCMASFVGHSLDLMDELAAASGHDFDLRPFGYDFVSEAADREIFGVLAADAEGVERIDDHETIRGAYPHLAPAVRQVVRVVRAGAFDVHALGSCMLSRARAAGVAMVRGLVEDLRPRGSGFVLRLADEAGGATELAAARVVLAAGPFVPALAAKAGIDLPIESFLQRKIVLPDPDGAVPRDMPFTIFADPQRLRWSDEEQELIAADPEDRWLLDELPAGLHVKPESQDRLKLGWAYNRLAEAPRWSHAHDPGFTNVVLRGAARFLPALEPYAARMPTPVVQYAGYYTRTPENWPLIGPLDEGGLYAVAALSGYGTMSACAAGELCADWMMGGALPAYARSFHPRRHDDPRLAAEISRLSSDGQL